jgi:hypothetical protein
MKKLTLMRLGPVVAFVFVVPFASAQAHKNQAFVPSTAAPAVTATPSPAEAAAAPAPGGDTAVTGVVVGDSDTGAGASSSRDFVVRTSDVNFRQMIARWAKEAGWNSEWAVEGDINVAGEYTWHDTDFVTAVRSTLRSTEGGETPVHGCYYSNNWVRVVPLTTPCRKQ